MTHRAETPTQPLIIFPHIPKAGGTTLTKIIARQYPRQALVRFRPPFGPLAALREFSQTLAPDVAIAKGHMPFGLHAFLPRQSTYITMLRNPVERVISNYYYLLLARTSDELHKILHSEGIGLEDFTSIGRPPAVDNLQTRLLSGRDLSPEPCAPGMLDEAKRNLREHFSVVGLTERFDETLIMLKRRFRWRSVLYERRRVTPDYPKRTSVAKDTLTAIERANQLDLELYDYACALFDEQLSRQAPDFEAELEAFRRVNRGYAGRPSVRRPGATGAGVALEGIAASTV